MELKIPSSLKSEHKELHAELARATKVKGTIGESAKAVAKVLHPHFVKEEEYALPPLGLLSSLADGKVTPEMKNALKMTDKLKSELPVMLEEHRTIIASLKILIKAAKKEKEYVNFADKLISHAKNEEEVLYPASLLVGEYLKLKGIE